MEHVLLTVAYLAAGILFILSLKGLSSQETAKAGNIYGAIGMIIAIGATLSSQAIGHYGPIAGAVVFGVTIGAIAAARVAMTAMPELVAMLNAFGGAAAVLVGYATYLGDSTVGVARTIHLVEIYLAVAIGTVTFFGSVVAALKLRGTLSGKPLVVPARHAVNGTMTVAVVVLGVLLHHYAGTSGLQLLLAGTVLAAVLGIHLVLAIGGADMPVVVSLLNSYSGWTAAAAGFMLGNDLLILTGALVGSSGAILSYIMCKAMNRSLWNVLFGGFGTADDKKPSQPTVDVDDPRTVNESSVGEAATSLSHANRVVIVPGYGMAVARAQHAVRDMVDILRSRGVEVEFGIHPVAGRLPGHMNVLLAEADVPYDIVHEMDDVNPKLSDTDVVLVVGANDIVNPGAQTDKHSLIYGMPVLEVWKAHQVLMLKRSRAAGYAGVDNPLFYHANTWMLFGDARDRVTALVDQLRAA